jgi:DNA-binding Lrp family transcriptional regulator
MPVDELPDWTTDMDIEILEALTPGLILTPAVIADNINRSREAVARRLNTLEAGGLVQKKGRGKYRITSDALWMLMEPVGVEFTEEDYDEMAQEIAEKERRIQEDLGMTVSEYQQEIVDEYRRLLSELEGYQSTDELIRKAADNVVERARADQ